MRIVLLIISEPDSANTSTSGCNCHGPSCSAPNGKAAPMRSLQASHASRPTMATLVGIGVPSKYSTLSPPSASVSAVTL